VGHSEGGAAACIAASESKDVAFVISLSGAGITGMKALLLQNEAIVNSAPITATNKQRFNTVNKILFEVVYEYAGDTALEQRLRTAYEQWRKADSVFIAPLDKKEYDHFFYPFESYVHQATGPWYRGFMTYEPSKVFPLIKVPVLAINGDKDIISVAGPNLEGFQQYVAKGLIQTWQVPGLNHLYQHCVTCTTSEYAELSETFAPEVLARIKQFIVSVK
jgi:pimeloyl-ACP methyl ester carboxylesterase